MHDIDHFKRSNASTMRRLRAYDASDGHFRLEPAIGGVPWVPSRTTPRPPAISKDNPAGTDGFEFVEFAHPEPEKLAELFTRMGYVPVARHRTKNITVWRQGDINYVAQCRARLARA